MKRRMVRNGSAGRLHTLIVRTWKWTVHYILCRIWRLLSPTALASAAAATEANSIVLLAAIPMVADACHTDREETRKNQK